MSDRDKPIAIKAKHATGYKTASFVDWNSDQIPAQIIDIAKKLQISVVKSRIAI